MIKKRKLYIDTRKFGGIARYINHSCDPNCELINWNVGGVNHACLFSSKTIKLDTELTFDYRWSIRSNNHIRAAYKCGTSNCRSFLKKIKYDSSDVVPTINKILYDKVIHQLVPKKYSISSNVIPLSLINNDESCYINCAIQMLFLFTHLLKH